ncbi:MAG: nitroreductase [Dehalococcoidia bacterium]|nr:nitroreductase [Dehalococcoidia bacterium]MCB9486110.1 nitroreductase [Thermoflexaceae bacterium]
MPERHHLTGLEAVAGRRSVRQFLADPVSLETVRELLDLAARSPSGTNVQPWNVHVVVGAARERVTSEVLQDVQAGLGSDEYPYAPRPWREPFVGRRCRFGFDLYAKYGIERDNMAGRAAAILRNYSFFGAPVGLFFTMDRDHLYGAWLDMGMFMQTVMIVARSFGLETCPQELWCHYVPAIRRAISIPEEQILVCGMALGYEDVSAECNTLVTTREPAERFATFHLE